MRINNTFQGPVFVLCGFFLCIAAVAADAGEAKRITKLWPENSGMDIPGSKEKIKSDRGDGHIRVTNIDNPSIEYFPAPDSAGPAPAIILCPGGGYKYLVITKMTPVAEWLNEQGVSAFILKYRTPKKRLDAFRDIQRAIRIVRSRASEWNIDPDRIGVMGSSAGGHLAARASTGFDIQTYQPVDEVDQFSCRPDFTVLLYPAYMNKGDALEDEFTLSADLPPTLIISAEDDTKFFKGSVVYARALEAAGASVRFHSFKRGGHGFTIQTEHYPLSSWPNLFAQWLRDTGMLKKTDRIKGKRKGP